MTRTAPRKARSKPARRNSELRFVLNKCRYWAELMEDGYVKAKLDQAEAQLAALLEDSRRRP